MSCHASALLHEPCSKTELLLADQQAWDALNEALKRGWVRSIGVDRYTPKHMEALNGTRPAVLMAPMSLQDHDESTLEYCQEKGIHVNAFGVMSGCMFTNPAVVQLARKYNASTSQICAVWTRQRGCSMAVGVGTDPLHIAEYSKEDLEVSYGESRGDILGGEGNLDFG